MRDSLKRGIARQAVSVVLAAVVIAPLALAGPKASIGGNSPALEGHARVIDGDTIDIGGNRIRLEGIDAPETTQTCGRRFLGYWRCGEEASRQLIRLIGDRPVACQTVGIDKYGRTLGRCYAGTVELNSEMVRTGYAWAFVKYSKTYASAEAAARRDQLGIWQGAAVPAWEFRTRAWNAAEVAAPDGCTIKGNVTAAGRIYHMPWSPFYEQVRMDQIGRGANKGKRWFCSEAEALQAGWRPAYGR